MFYSGSSGEGFSVTKKSVERIYKRAKSSDHTLTEAEIMECLQAANG